MIEVLDKRVGSVLVPQDGLIVYNAEVKIKNSETGEILYINVNTAGESTVAKESIHDLMLSSEDFPDDYEPVEFLEEYMDEDETKESKYSEYFDIAYNLIDEEEQNN
jgi:hypothetical protein